MSKTSGARIQLFDISKHYESQPAPAVDRVALDIAPGEFLTLLGPSGSGKTTTLNLIAGFVKATSGRIEVNGRVVDAIPTHKRNFGMVFQNYALFPHMSVYDNVAFPLRQRRVKQGEIDEQVRRMLQLVDLVGLDRRKPAQLSGGQQQRVALARALVFSPPALLLDEPMGALDRKLRQSLQAEIKRLHRELQLTFVFVTHDQEEAMFLSDRIAVFNRGRIERVGTPEDLYHQPGTRFVAEFLGESNVFAGRRTASDTYEWGEHRWRIRTDGSRPASDADVLIVRPERVRILAPGAVLDPGHNASRATVTNVGFLGTVARVELCYGDGSTGCAVLPPDADLSIRAGAEVLATWDSRDQVLVQE